MLLLVLVRANPLVKGNKMEVTEKVEEIRFIDLTERRSIISHTKAERVLN